MQEHSVSVRSLKIAYGRNVVLDDLSIDVARGEFLVLLGSSGCGKSTLLNAIAGLQDVTDGQIIIAGQDVTWTDPKDRDIGMVFQSYALYPRMTVEGNMGFGLRVRGMPKAEVAERVSRVAKLLQVEHLLKRRPSDLSGGQRQRVAIGRALVRDADVFLFDEPLSNLDAQLRTDLRVELKTLHQDLGNTMIYVTHDQIEAMTLADRIAIMKDGVIQQLAAPGEIYNRPANLFVAGFIGSPRMNLIEGQITGGTFTSGALRLPTGLAAPDGPTVMGVRPEHVSLAPAATEAALEGKVDLVEELGPETVLRVQLADGQHVSLRVAPGPVPQPGETVGLSVDASAANYFDKATGDRLTA